MMIYVSDICGTRYKIKIKGVRVIDMRVPEEFWGRVLGTQYTTQNSLSPGIKFRVPIIRWDREHPGRPVSPINWGE